MQFFILVKFIFSWADLDYDEILEIPSLELLSLNSYFLKKFCFSIVPKIFNANLFLNSCIYFQKIFFDSKYIQNLYDDLIKKFTDKTGVFQIKFQNKNNGFL